MFFEDQYSQFFRPLSSKYREQIVECLRALYQRVYGSVADYSQVLDREQLIEIFQDTVTRTPLLLEDEDLAVPMDAQSKTDREQANWILNTLLEYAWLEKQVDEASLQSTYAFSRMGRLFTQPFVETGAQFRTRHRNTRNTRNALQSFVEEGVEDMEVHDLLDAFEYSERIISDFTDVIAELDDKKRQLVKAVESQQLVEEASEEFFDFMEKRFMPDIAVRLSADSVEKYRDEIQQLIEKAKRKRKDFKAKAESELRKLAPGLTVHERSYYLFVLDGISSRLHNACEVMLPALRRALHGFTRRADIIIRQLSFTRTGEQSELLDICRELQEAGQEPGSTTQNQRLANAGEAFSSLQVGFIDPANIKMYARRSSHVVNTRVEQHEEMGFDSRKDLFIRQTMDQAFSINSKAQVDYILGALKQGHRISSQDLPVSSAKELMHAAHIIEAASAGNSSEFKFRVIDEGRTDKTEYFESTDVFTLELVSAEND